jgi:hypothetical protein
MPSDSATAAAAPARRPFIAPAWHTLSLLLTLGFFSIYDALHAHGAGSSQAAATRGAVVCGYLLAIFYEWEMAAWGGERFKGSEVQARENRSSHIDLFVLAP